MEFRNGVSASGAPSHDLGRLAGAGSAFFLPHVSATLPAREAPWVPSLVAQTSRVQSGSPVPVPRSHSS